MTKEEMKNRIEAIEDSLFYINMKDRWSNEDYKKVELLNKERFSLLDKLNKE